MPNLGSIILTDSKQLKFTKMTHRLASLKILNRYFSSGRIKTYLSILSILASIATVISVLPILFPPDRSDPKIFGQWESDYSYPIKDGTLRVQGLTSYFHQGKYNVSGTITLEGHVDQQAYKFDYSAMGAGTWTTTSDRLSITLTSLKTTAKSLNVGGIDISPQLVARLTGQPLPTLNDAYPEGMSDEFTLQSIAENTIVLGAKDPFGKPFTIEMHRRPAPSN